MTLPFEYQTVPILVWYSDESGIQVFDIQMVTVQLPMITEIFDATTYSAWLPALLGQSDPQTWKYKFAYSILEIMPDQETAVN